MLVLSRKQHEDICLPDLGVKIKVLQPDNKSVRIGIDAPKDIPSASL